MELEQLQAERQRRRDRDEVRKLDHDLQVAEARRNLRRRQLEAYANREYQDEIEHTAEQQRLWEQGQQELEEEQRLLERSHVRKGKGLFSDISSTFRPFLPWNLARNISDAANHR